MHMYKEKIMHKDLFSKTNPLCLKTSIIHTHARPFVFVFINASSYS